MYAKIPTGKIIIVSPPEQWVRWGLVKPGVYWTLEKAVYGLRESPYLWSEERDRQLEALRWKVANHEYSLKRCSADSQLWLLKEHDGNKRTVLGLLVVYVDDFLLQTRDDAVRTSFLATLGSVWTLAKQETLSEEHPITFLGIDMVLRKN